MAMDEYRGQPEFPSSLRIRPITSKRYTAILPDEQEIEVSALGSSRRRGRERPARKVEVQVVHGNLSGATEPVLVSHYVGDFIVNAEAYLDAQLDGRLREAQRLGLYPGEL